MKYLVTGATGLLGNTITRQLLDRGEQVRVYGRGSADREELRGLDVQFVSGELHDEASLTRAIEDCQVVIHSAAMIHIGYKRLDEARLANVAGSEAIARACLTAGSKLLYISTVDTLPAATATDCPVNETSRGLPKTECTYVISKREAEQKVAACVQAGLNAVILHPGFMLGPYDWKPSSGTMMLAIHKAPTVVAPRGTASVCDARDVASAVLNAASKAPRGEHYILAGENIPYPDLCRRILAVMHKNKKVFRMGPVIPAVARTIDWWNRISGARERVFNGAAIAMGQLHHAYDSSKAERELEYSRRELDVTLHDAWQWLQARFVK